MTRPPAHPLLTTAKRSAKIARSEADTIAIAASVSTNTEYQRRLLAAAAGAYQLAAKRLDKAVAAMQQGALRGTPHFQRSAPPAKPAIAGSRYKHQLQKTSPQADVLVSHKRRRST